MYFYLMQSVYDDLMLHLRNDHVSYFKLPGSTRALRCNYTAGMRNQLMKSKSKYLYFRNLLFLLLASLVEARMLKTISHGKVIQHPRSFGTCFINIVLPEDINYSNGHVFYQKLERQLTTTVVRLYICMVCSADWIYQWIHVLKRSWKTCMQDSK